MPCGLLYAALALAVSASSIAEGALTMLAFGIGTLPVMAGLGLVFARLVQSKSKASVLRRGAGVLMLAVGLWSTIGVAKEAVTPQKHACCAHRAEAAR